MRKLVLTLVLLGSVPLTANEIVIRAARVVEGRGAVIPDAAIDVDGPRIVRIEKHASALKHVDYDLKGVTLMPGGIDTHVHIGWHFDADGRSHDDEPDRNETPEETMAYAMEHAYRTLIGGITTVQSLGAPTDKPLRDAIPPRAIPGPPNLSSIRPVHHAPLPPDHLR